MQELDRFGGGGWTPARLPDLKGKTYVVTGANIGIGFQATKSLTGKGARVLMLCRDLAKAEAAAADIKRAHRKAELTIVQMDLSELASVRNGSAEVLKHLPTIDGLICNAGIMMTPTRKLTGDGFELQLAVNHFSHFLLAGILFPQIAKDGRIVTTSSVAHRSGLKRIKFEDINFANDYRGWTAYSQSKLANLMFGLELDRRLQATGSKVRAVVCHPGIAATNLTTSVGPFLRPLMRFGNLFIAQSATTGAWPTLLAATDPEAKAGGFYGPTRRGESGGPVRQVAPAAHALDEAAAAKLWELSEKSIGINWPAG